ncbi:P-loop containing nucleoside triphosphate hydrolase protein [Auriscalpium vulgare]|uniref:P-loop containing nucleoside triphosphate hydrolase protein n=1 Tax=Auriscalpium vulgare TaxID=40419 RepID=A0ACB8S9Y9_9AGAM|nr:P-loop containing nucleoside triphosphate hydrolase protein [Auriscalpium vulgare]
MAIDPEPATSEPLMPMSRKYQEEMLEESLRRNIVIALDTGAGKTHIAVLRMKLEAERVSRKVSWFLAPTVALALQQHQVIAGHLPVSVGMISGSMEPDQWKDAELWRRVLATHRIMVTTHDVLLNALRHGYINMGRDINLLIFDEAHHAADRHPYNLIMQEFYTHLPPRPQVPEQVSNSEAVIRPMVLGLTASPIFGGDVERAFSKIESNLDCIIRAPLLYREELAGFVHRPEFKHVIYPASPYQMIGPPPSRNVASLANVLQSLNIDDDPYVLGLRQQLSKMRKGPEWTRIDQKLSKTISKKDTYTHKGLRDFWRAADEICMDLGEWAADWFVQTVKEQAMRADMLFPEYASTWSSREKAYLMDTLSRIEIVPVSYDAEDIVARSSPKLTSLIEALLQEKIFFEGHDEDYRGLVFVTRRDAVLALTELLTHHPLTAQLFQVGSLLGNSENSRRHSFLDITRYFLKQPATQTLNDFRSGDLNLIIATAVAEEGLDIQACCSVVRWDPPPNMVSWAQSRGRARQKRSSFIVMFSDDLAHRSTVSKWELLEQEMVRLYNTDRRDPAESTTIDEDDSAETTLRFRAESTGALLTSNSAIEHLNHFCSIIPHSGRGNHAPVYDVDPPEYPPEWHSYGGSMPLYDGPYGCTVTLPKLVDPAFRTFSTPCLHRTKISAKRHVAFQAYMALYEHGLLNENLLPLTSVLEPELEDEVRNLLKEVEKRDGTARVTSQLDPWVPSDSQDLWWSTELSIEGMPRMKLLSRAKVAPLLEDDMPVLHSRERPFIQVRVVSQSSPASLDAETLFRARAYTRETLWPIYGPRMKWEDMDFLHLILPPDDDYSSEWRRRREAHNAELETDRPPYRSLFAPSTWFLKQFGRQSDLFIVGASGRFGKVYQFLHWRTGPVSDEEETALRERYAPDDGDVVITYPLLEVKTLVKRNFLLPMPVDSKGLEASSQKPFLLLEDSTSVGLISPQDAQFALWLPSILRSLAMTNTVIDMRDTLFTDTPLSSIPLRLLLAATTAPVSQECSNYQRLETLGDTVLKYVVSIQLLAEFPLWHEGYLARRKDHSVSNARLAKAAIRLQLYTWIIRDMYAPKKWKPRHSTVRVEETSVHDESARPDASPKTEKEKRKAKTKGELSTKVLADVVEALIGAAYIHGGFDLGVECARVFDLGIPWRRLPERIDSMRSRAVDLDHYPMQLSAVEAMIGHTFQKKSLLVEALTHVSYQSDLETISYERMEFLGDSVLDMIVTDYLFHLSEKDYSPGNLHLRKTAVVNAHFLAMLCLRASTEAATGMPKWSRGKVTVQGSTHQVYLWQCLLHSSMPVLDEQNITFARWSRPSGAERIEAALAEGKVYPWAALTSLRAPKFMSDMIESILGAVFVDASGDLDVVRGVLRKLGLLQILEHIVETEMDVTHPVSRLHLWASKRHEKVKCGPSVRKDGRVSCTAVWEGYEVARVEDEWRGRISQEDVRFSVAEQAIELLEHPPSFLRIWAARRKLNAELVFEDCDGTLSCVARVDGQEVVRVLRRGDASEADMELAAATAALKAVESPVSWLEFVASRHAIEVDYVVYEDDGKRVCCAYLDGLEAGRYEAELQARVSEEEMLARAAKDAAATLEKRIASVAEAEVDAGDDAWAVDPDEEWV